MGDLVDRYRDLGSFCEANTLQVPGQEPKLVIVKRIGVTVMVGAVLLWTATPVMACLIPCLAPTPSKQECAHHMGMDCGHPMMTAGRTCCQMSSSPGLATVETQVSRLQKRVHATVSVLDHAFLSDNSVQPSSPTIFKSPPNETPPLLSVLRI